MNFTDEFLKARPLRLFPALVAASEGDGLCRARRASQSDDAFSPTSKGPGLSGFVLQRE